MVTNKREHTHEQDVWTISTHDGSSNAADIQRAALRIEAAARQTHRKGWQREKQLFCTRSGETANIGVKA